MVKFHVTLIGVPSRAPLKLAVYVVFAASGASGSRNATPGKKALFTSAVTPADDPGRAADGTMIRAAWQAMSNLAGAKDEYITLTPTQVGDVNCTVYLTYYVVD